MRLPDIDIHVPRDIPRALRREVFDWQRWLTRLVVLGHAVAAGGAVVAFTWLAEQTLELFFKVSRLGWWVPLIWMPAGTALVVWLTRRWAAGAAGSGIPQVMAALDRDTPLEHRGLFVSLKLSAAKVGLTSMGLLFGLSLGREGPSVQIAAGLMQAARRWLPRRSRISDHGLLVAGIAAAFNTPLGGVMFAIEELSRRPEERNSGLLVSAIVLAGLMGVSFYGNSPYFGLIRVPQLGWGLFWPGLLVTVWSGLAGGLFSRLMIQSLTGKATDRFSRWRQREPVKFAAACGLVIAVIGLVTAGATLGSGYGYTRDLLEGSEHQTGLYAVLKFVATWLTAWSGVPGGIFAPSLAIGAGLGQDVAQLTGTVHGQALIALGMVGFLAAVTQAPLTSFIIVMEMVDGHAMVLSLMSCAITASVLSRLLSPPLYGVLAAAQLQRLPTHCAPPPVEDFGPDTVPGQDPHDIAAGESRSGH
jgi:H+/Cl- antiporter ClcA